jgi:hypothetical protein
MDPPGYIKPDLQDFLLTDITCKELADELEVDYLGPAAFPGTFPAIGNIKGLNHRLMVSLVCRRRTKASPFRQHHLFDRHRLSRFLHLPGSYGSADWERLPPASSIVCHSENAVDAHLSPKDSHFTDVNVLGMDFLMDNKVFPRLDFVQKTFINISQSEHRKLPR